MAERGDRRCRSVRDCQPNVQAIGASARDLGVGQRVAEMVAADLISVGQEARCRGE
jgi:hypothetical protein